MIALDGAASAQLASQIKGVAWFVDLNFLSGSLYYNTTAESYVVDGHNYQGIGGLTDISQIHESDSATPSKITLSFALTKRSLIAATIGNAAEYRNRRVKIYLQLMSETMQPVGAKVLRWSGYMDKVSVEKSRNEGGYAGTIKLSCSKPGINRARNVVPLRITHSQRLIDHPTDLGTEYLQDLIERPVLWLSKKFQEI